MRDSAPSLFPVDPSVSASLPSGPGLSRRGWLGGAVAGLATLTAPAWAARKARAAKEPAGVVLPAPQDDLPQALAARLQETGLPLESYGLHVQPLDGGAPVVSWQAGRAFVLASTSKVITSMAALDLLGPDYRWRTRAYLSGPLTQGRLLGDLVIRGGGDASLTSEHLQEWFARLREQGLQEIWGDIILNREAFQLRAEDLVSTPEPTPERPHHMRPDALALDAGVVKVAVQSDGGGRASIQVTPPLQDVRLVNAIGRGSGCVASAVYRDPDGAMQPQLQVSGQWSARCGVQQIRFAPVSMRDLTHRAIGSLWLQAGGVLRGRVVEHTASSPTPWLVHGQGATVAPFDEWLSEPMADQLRDMNKRSDNLIARHLMLSLSPGFPDRPATPDASRGRMAEWLRRKGLRPDLVGVDTGSGLSRQEKATPQALAFLLARAARGPHAKLLRQSLPVAGVDGTLEGRLRGSAAEGQAWLKTGTLLDTRALAGYVRTRGGRMMAVVLIANHPDQVAAATPALDACADWVARLA